MIKKTVKTAINLLAEIEGVEKKELAFKMGIGVSSLSLLLDKEGKMKVERLNEIATIMGAEIILRCKTGEEILIQI